MKHTFWSVRALIFALCFKKNGQSTRQFDFFYKYCSLHLKYNTAESNLMWCLLYTKQEISSIPSPSVPPSLYLSRVTHSVIIPRSLLMHHCVLKLLLSFLKRSTMRLDTENHQLNVPLQPDTLGNVCSRLLRVLIKSTFFLVDCLVSSS